MGAILSWPQWDKDSFIMYSGTQIKFKSFIKTNKISPKTHKCPHFTGTVLTNHVYFTPHENTSHLRPHWVTVMVFAERFHCTWKNFSPSSCSLRCWSAARFWNLEAKWISWAEVFSLRTLYFCWACVYRRCSWSWKNYYVIKKLFIRCYFFHSQLIHWQIRHWKLSRNDAKFDDKFIYGCMGTVSLTFCNTQISREHLRELTKHLQMSCSDFTTWQGTRTVIAVKAIRMTCLIEGGSRKAVPHSKVSPKNTNHLILVAQFLQIR